MSRWSSPPGLAGSIWRIELDPVSEPVLGQDPHFLIEKKGAPPHFTEQVGGDLGFVRASAFLLKKQRVKIQIEHLHISQRVDLDGTVLRHGAHQSLPKYLPPPQPLDGDQIAVLTIQGDRSVPSITTPGRFWHSPIWRRMASLRNNLVSPRRQASTF